MADGFEQSGSTTVDTNGRAVLRPRAMFYLNQANHAVRSRLEAAFEDHDLTAIQFTALSVIGRNPGLSSAELSRRFFVTPQTMNELIAGLERRGLIARTADPANRRILRMRVTGTGSALLEECEARADSVEQAVFAGLTNEEYTQLAALTRKVSRHLRKIDEAD